MSAEFIGEATCRKDYRIKIEFYNFDPKYSTRYKLRNGNWCNMMQSINSPECESNRILDKFTNGQLRLNTSEDFELFYELNPQVKSFKIWINNLLFIESSNPNDYIIEKRCDCCGQKI